MTGIKKEEFALTNQVILSQIESSYGEIIEGVVFVEGFSFRWRSFDDEK